MRVAVDIKEEIIKKHEEGMQVTNISAQYQMVKSTILKQKDVYKACRCRLQ